MSLSGDTRRVTDMGNGRIQTIALDAGFVRRAPLPPGASMGEIDLNGAGPVLA